MRRVARAGRGSRNIRAGLRRRRPRRGSKRRCRICPISRTHPRTGACGSSSATITDGRRRSTIELEKTRRDDSRTGQRPKLATRNAHPGQHRGIGTELARRGNGSDDDRLQYALEWGFFTRCQWGEFDTALYELERCWGKSPESPAPIGAGPSPATERTIKSLDDVHQAVAHYVESIPYDRIIATATHLSTDIDYRMVSDAEMAAAIARRGQAGPAERDCYASYVNELFLTKLEGRGEKLVFQFSFGAEPLPFETASRLSQRTIGQVAEMIGRHPTLKFQCFLGSRHANQSMCTLVRELPNLSLAGYWWHNFFPSAIAQVMHERIEMLPANKQVGFFSDAYCAEWSYAKAVIVRKVMAKVLAERIELAISTRARPWILHARSFISPHKRCWEWLRGRRQSK